MDIDAKEPEQDAEQHWLELPQQTLCRSRTED
jgi:hypothetical protein